MMDKTPSARRRLGRLAFFPGCDPKYFCPYKTGFMFEEKARDWMDGWNEAAEEYECNARDTERVIDITDRDAILEMLGALIEEPSLSYSVRNQLIKLKHGIERSGAFLS